MGFFSRSPRKLLPPDAATHLAAYGRADFGPATSEIPDLGMVQFITRLCYDPDLQQNASEVVRELRDIGLDSGGWGLYGATSAVAAFFPSEEGSPPELELRDARLAFVHGLGLPRTLDRIEGRDRARYKQLFQDSPGG